MNLWGKRIGQLSLLAVALFFLSCEDEASRLGFKNPTTKLDVSYIEIPVESSVILLDSIRSSNYLASFSTETQRLLAGNYTDGEFGAVHAESYSQYFSTSRTKLDATAAYDAITLSLRFDFYTYGSTSAITTQKIYIHELDKELKYDSVRNYFTKTKVPFIPTPLGAAEFTIDPAAFEGYLAVKKDTTITVQVPLSDEFGQRIFASALRYRDATNRADSAFVRYSDFVKEFKGIAIIPGEGDKVFGFSPSSAASKLSIRYHTATKDSLELVLAFSGTTSFNNITSNKDGTELSGLVPPYYQDYAVSDRRFIQSGTGVFTKLDFSKFYEFADEIPNMIINSAELVIGSVEEPGSLAPPTDLVLRVLKNNNRQYRYTTSNPQTGKDLSLYNGFINIDFAGNSLGVAVDSDSTFTAINDFSAYLKLAYAKDSKSYQGFISLFMQQLFYEEPNKTRFRYFVLYPSTPAAAKTVNRVIFPKDAIKLKIYYTKPNTTN